RMLLGSNALDARLHLLRGARRSLDLQYYHLHNDATGRLALRELRNAAQRGVRVRLLLDDLYTDDIEALLHGLGAYPNVEIRLFNPFAARGSLSRRYGAALFDFARANRRMHNKMLVADGTLAVAGGRNLGNEYFFRGREANFFDVDVLIAGAVLPQMSSIFDEYWNAPQVRTASGVLARQALAGEALRRDFDERVDGPDTPEWIPFRGSEPGGRKPLVDELADRRVELTLGTAQAFADAPGKAWGEQETGRLPSGALLDHSRRVLSAGLHGARDEIWMASPYLVPDTSAVDGMAANIRGGVHIHLLTNSLAATDEPVVHTGYRRHRDNMLRAGVRIHELHPDLGQRMLASGITAVGTILRMHTKFGVVDRRRLFIGSVNFDPRSDQLNTEFGILIESPALATDAQRLIERLAETAAYRVRLKDGTERDLQWVRAGAPDGEAPIEREPGASLWTRAKLYIQSILIPESML
ncbi:MAG: phospholipase D family protein, partial [Comamonadaceae bacterium]